MERGKKRIYTCIVMVVLAAVVIGVIYYWGEIGKTNIENDGTLVLLEGRNIWL